jgi:hypothetical protein
MLVGREHLMVGFKVEEMIFFIVMKYFFAIE